MAAHTHVRCGCVFQRNFACLNAAVRYHLLAWWPSRSVCAFAFYMACSEIDGGRPTGYSAREP